MAPSRIGLFIVGANRQIPSIGGNLGLAHLQILHLTTTCFCCFQMPLCYSPSIEYNLQHLKASPAIRNSHSNETVLFPGWLIGRRVNVVAALRAAGVTVLVRARAGCTEPHVVLAPVCSKNPCSGSVLLIGPHSDLSDVPCPSPGEAFKSTPRATRGGGHRARSQRCSRDQHSCVRHQVSTGTSLAYLHLGTRGLRAHSPLATPLLQLRRQRRSHAGDSEAHTLFVQWATCGIRAWLGL